MIGRNSYIYLKEYYRQLHKVGYFNLSEGSEFTIQTRKMMEAGWDLSPRTLSCKYLNLLEVE